jgi:hypothetical protein
MKRGYRDPETGEIIEQQNQVAIALWPEQTRHNWFCSQCGIFMKAYPISHDLPFTHWSCTNCKKNITANERDESFNAHVKIAKERYDLKTLEYNKEDRSWNIESSIFVGDSRIGAKRKVIRPSELEQIVNEVQDMIEAQLHISFENWSEFWATD